MKDCNGQDVRVGDRVELWNGKHGTIVCSIDTGEFTTDFPEAEWGYLKTGVVIRTDSGDLFHYAEPDEDFELITRGGTP